MKSEDKIILKKVLKSLRNRIVHDYDGVNLSMIWGFLTTELTELEIQINSIIETD